MSGHNAANAASRERLMAVSRRLGDRVLTLGGGWTATALLAHLGFWDRLAAARLEKYLRDREAPTLGTPALRDLINAAGMRQWLDAPPRIAAAHAREAAAAMDELVRSLSEDDLSSLMAFGYPLLYDRSGHRNQHLDEIERALG